jgi:hypothetical protein
MEEEGPRRTGHTRTFAEFEEEHWVNDESGCIAIAGKMSAEEEAALLAWSGRRPPLRPMTCRWSPPSSLHRTLRPQTVPRPDRIASSSPADVTSTPAPTTPSFSIARASLSLPTPRWCQWIESGISSPQP